MIHIKKFTIKGGLASGIPGEIAGFWEAHKKAGRLPWKRLFKPSIELCRDGIPVSKVLAFILSTQEMQIRTNAALAKIFINPLTNQTYEEKDRIKHLSLASTLEMISNDPEIFYKGKLAERIVEENNANGMGKNLLN